MRVYSPSFLPRLTRSEDCICGEFIVRTSRIASFTELLMRPKLVIDKHLGILPKRQTDGATIVRVLDDEHGKARVWKLNAAAKLNDPIIVERSVNLLVPSRAILITPYQARWL